jgi:hypothetical protein
MLDAAFITECEQRARRFSGAYTGTSGSLAAAVILLIKERKELMATLKKANQAVRDAVHQRLEGTPEDDPKLVGWDHKAKSCCDGGKCQPQADAPISDDWILRGQRELEESRQTQRLGDGVAAATDLRPGSREFVAILEEAKQLHLRKTLDYGVDEDALSNIRSSADVVNMQPWAGCVLRMMDKMHRIKAYFRRGKVEFDGIEDTLMDILCYAAIALVFYRQGRKP